MTDTTHTPADVAVSRDDAIKFLESACRNWEGMGPLSNDDVDDVAGSLTAFLKQRLTISPPVPAKEKVERAVAVLDRLRSSPKEPTDDVVERVARAICAADGSDPDELVQAGNPIGEPADYPHWMLFLPNARAALQASHQGEVEQIVAWHRTTAKTLRSIAKMGLPSHSPVIARAEADWHDKTVTAIERGDHRTNGREAS